MKRTVIAAIVAASLMGCAKKPPLLQQEPETAKEDPIGRYQLFAGERAITEFHKDKTASEVKEKVILRIDTTTGQVDQLEQVLERNAACSTIQGWTIS